MASTLIQIPRFFWRAVVRPGSSLLRQRIKLGRELQNLLGGTICSGPLRGVRLNNDPTWGAADRGAMLVGFYEREVLDRLTALSSKGSVFVDIGAADGYFGVGLVAAGIYERSICFEKDPVTREALVECADLNGVRGRIEVFGSADNNLIGNLLQAKVDPSRAVILCDIEGGEFDLFSDVLLSALAKSHILIELHEGGNPELAAALLNRASLFFDVSYIESGPRFPNEISILQHFSEDDRWLICSEGRMCIQRWMVLSPCAKNSPL